MVLDFVVRGRRRWSVCLLPGQALMLGSGAGADRGFEDVELLARHFYFQYEAAGLTLKSVMGGALTVNGQAVVGGVIELGDQVSLLPGLECLILSFPESACGELQRILCPKCRAEVSMSCARLLQFLRFPNFLEFVPNQCDRCSKFRGCLALSKSDSFLSGDLHFSRGVTSRLIRRAGGLTKAYQFSCSSEKEARVRTGLGELSDLGSKYKARLLRAEVSEGRVSVEEEWYESEWLWSLSKPMAVRSALRLLGQLLDFLGDCESGGVFSELSLKHLYVVRAADFRLFVHGFGIGEVYSASLGSGYHGVMGQASPEELKGLCYFSPECMDNRLNRSVKSQIFSLGAIVYEMLSGQAPHFGKTARSIIMAILNSKRATLNSMNLGVPNDLEELVEAMMSVEPERRPSLQELRSRLKLIQKA